MWQNDADPVWSAHPRAWHEAFPHGSLSQGRALLRQIHNLGLVDVDADAELDIVRANTPLAEFYRLSMAALAGPTAATSALTPEEATALVERPTDSHFLGCDTRMRLCPHRRLGQTTPSRHDDLSENRRNADGITTDSEHVAGSQ